MNKKLNKTKHQQCVLKIIALCSIKVQACLFTSNFPLEN